MTAHQGPSRRLRVLFTAAFVGTNVIVVMALLQLSPFAGIAYLILSVVALVLLVPRARALPQSSGRTCECCTSTVFDPVTVVDERAR